jgi:hypothetical protein
MSTINVTVTSAGAANVSVSNGSTVSATVGNGGAVNVSTGTISPGNATVVSGTLTINSTTTLAAGSQAYVKNDAGTAYAAKLDIGIPAGPATTVTVGNTTTLAAGSNATVSGTTNGSTLTLAFAIPRGADGTNGTTPTFAIGNVVTGAAGSSASVTATTSNSGANVTLDLTIPRGDPGTNGTNGTGGSNLTLSDATPSNLGTAAAGSSNLAARADHVHLLPSLSTLGAAAAAHGHNYVTSLNNLTGGLTLAAGGNVTITSANSTLTIAASGGLGENDAVDGGNYVGEILGGITFSVQPQSQTVTVSASSLSYGNASSNLSINSSSAVGMAAFGGRLLVSTVSGLHQSTNNGANWSPVATWSLSGTAGQQFSSPPSVTSNGTRNLIAAGGQQYSSGEQDHLKLYYSDAADLSNATAVSGAYARSVAYLPSANRFVAATGPRNNLEGTEQLTNGDVLSSSDGVNWSQRISGQAFNFVFAISDRFVLVVHQADAAKNATYWSSDGVTWNSVTLPSSFFAYGAASNGSRLVAVSNSSTSTRYTSNGETWTTGTLPVACNRISYAAGMFWAFNSSAASTDICTSPDGVTWTLRDGGASRSYLSAASAASSNLVLLVNDGGLRQATLSAGTASANLAVSASASGGNPVSYQWQRSVDAGTNWNAIANATSAALNLTGLVQSDNGTRYRALASANGATSVTSQSATLTVTG